jgi:hypothetical protein
VTIYLIEGSDRYHDSGGSWIVKAYVNKNDAYNFVEKLNGLIKECDRPKGYRLPLKDLRKQIKEMDSVYLVKDQPSYYVTETELVELIDE